MQTKKKEKENWRNNWAYLLPHIVSSIEVALGSTSMVQQQVLTKVVVSSRIIQLFMNYDFIYKNNEANK